MYNLKQVLLSQQWIQIIAILSGSLIALNGGLFFAWPSPSIPILTSTTHSYNFTREAASYLTVIPSGASILAAPFWSALMNRIGRQRTLLLVALPQLTSWLVIAQARTVNWFYAARFISGWAQSCIYAVLPVYIGEICSPGVRGLWGNTMSFSVYFGLFLMNIVGSYFSIQNSAYIFAAVPILFFITFLAMPESPYYHIMRNNLPAAETSLRRLRNKQRANHEELLNSEFKQLVLDVNRQLDESRGNFKDVLGKKINRNLVCLGIAVRAMQQYSGISAFNSYSQIMFGGSASSEESSSGFNNASTFAIIYTGTLSFSVFTGSLVLDRIGRRNSMTISCIICGIALTGEAVFSYFRQLDESLTQDVFWFPIVGMIVYVLSYSIGLGIVPNLLLGEMFPASIKGKAICLVTIFFGIFSSSSNYLYELLLRTVGDYCAFGLFACCCFISSVISYYCVPETSGKTLEEIQQDFKKKKKSISVSTVNNNNINITVIK